MDSNAVQHTREHLVMMGIGPSGIEFLKEWLQHPVGFRVTIVGEDPSDLFYWKSLCGLKGLNWSFSNDPQNETNLNFLTATVDNIDFEKNTLLLSGGTLRFDRLVVVNEAKPKLLMHRKANVLSQFATGEEYINWIQDSVSRVIIRGGGFAAIAMADRLLEMGLKVTMVSNESRLAIQRMPEEEACLVAKKLKSRGVYLVFNEKIKNFLLDEAGKINGVRLDSGTELPAQAIIHDKGTFPDLQFLRANDYTSGETYRVSPQLGLETKDRIFAIGQKLAIFDADLYGDRNTPVATQGALLARYLKGDSVQLEEAFDRKDFYQLAGLEWRMYGDFSTFWGKSSHNFYWEHPNGETAFRLLFHQHDFSILALATLGIDFDRQFLNNAFTERCKALDFINKMKNEVHTGENSEEIIVLISKAFTVEFKGLRNETRTSLFGKILEKFL